MAGEYVALLGPDDFQRETDLGNDASVSLVLAPGESSQTGASGDIRGLSLPRYKTSGQAAYGYTALFRIPANLTLTTGLTFDVYLSDDGKNSLDLGKAVEIGLTLKRLAAGATLDADSGAAAEVTAAVTLASASGEVAIGTVAIANAALPAGVAVGDLLLVRLRRVGTSSGDTCPGRAILYALAVQNT